GLPLGIGASGVPGTRTARSCDPSRPGRPHEKAPPSIRSRGDRRRGYGSTSSQEVPPGCGVVLRDDYTVSIIHGMRWHTSGAHVKAPIDTLDAAAVTA